MDKMRDERISCLLVTRNRTRVLIDLVKHVYDVVDDIVIIDSSDGKKLAALRTAMKNFKRVKVYYAVPLGYEEPYRMYGLKKTKHEWILSIDADQRLNPEFRRDIQKIIHDNQKFSGFLARQDNFLDGKRIYGESYGIRFGKNDWQLRLFRKSKVLFRGIVHEAPDLGGRWTSRTGKELRAHFLPNKYRFIQHHEQGDFSYKIMKTMKLEMFECRHTYGSTKLPGPLKVPARLYGLIKGRGQDRELTMRDYLTHERLYAILNNGEPSEWFRPMPYYFRRKVATIFAAEPILRDLSFAISEDIRKEGGVIKYLGFDGDSAIRNLNRKYKNTKLKGIDLFIVLLVEEFYRKHPKWRSEIPPLEVVGLLDNALEKSGKIVGA